MRRDGIITRTAHSNNNVEYALTPFGLSFARPATSLLSWAARFLADLEAERTLSKLRDAINGNAGDVIEEAA